MCMYTSGCFTRGLPTWYNGKESTCQCRRHGRRRFDPWVGKIPWRRDRLPTPVFLGFPYGSAGEVLACNAGDLGSIPRSGRSLGEGKGCQLQNSGQQNSTDCVVHGVTKSQARLSDFHKQDKKYQCSVATPHFLLNYSLTYSVGKVKINVTKSPCFSEI